MKPLAALPALVLLLCTCGLGSCGAPREDAPIDDALAAPPVLAPWTTRFQGEGSFLVADVIEIEGPNGLLDHVAATQDPERFVYTAEHDGGAYRQVFELKAGAPPGELRAQLDGWAIVAMRKLVIVERLDDVPVRVRAAGAVSFHDAASGEAAQDVARHEVVGQRPGVGPRSEER